MKNGIAKSLLFGLCSVFGLTSCSAATTHTKTLTVGLMVSD